MSEHRLVIEFSRPASPAANYWLRMVQEDMGDDLATVAEVAGLVDALFNIEPCDPESGSGGEEQPIDATTGEPIQPVTEDEFNLVVAENFDFSACRVENDGSYEATIRVYRSHLDEPYRLVVNNGELLRTVRTEEAVRIDITVDSSAQIDLPMPVLSGFSASWYGTVYDENGPCDPPEITLTGATLHFGRAVTGRITAAFVTEYDQVTVMVHGLDGEVRDGSLLAFYHGLVFEDIVRQPPVDEAVDRRFCDSGGGGGVTLPDAECYQLVHLVTRCRCSDREVSRETVTRVVQCPDGYAPGTHLVGSETVTVDRVDCGESDDDISDPEFYEQICCEPPAPDFPLPRCVRKTTVYRGGKGIDGGADRYRAVYGDNVRLVAVSPENGVCGEMTVEQVKKQRNCCDGAAPIEWDYDNSAEIIGSTSKATVFVTGGVPPYNWSVRARGASFDRAGYVRDVQTASPHVTIYTHDACGSIPVYVSDGCSSTSEYLRSTVGQWELIETCDCPDCVSVFTMGAYLQKYLYQGNKKHVLYFRPDCRCTHFDAAALKCWPELFSNADLAALEGDSFNCIWWGNSWSYDCCHDDLCRLCVRKRWTYEWIC